MQTNYPVSFPITVHWGQMDALGHVNNARYFEFFEAARIEYFRKVGQEELQAGQGDGPVLAQIGCQFMRPVTYPDNLAIGCWVERIGNTSLKMNYEVYSQKEKAVMATGESIVVMIDYTTGKKVPVSAETKEQIYGLQPELRG